MIGFAIAITFVALFLSSVMTMLTGFNFYSTMRCEEFSVKIASGLLFLFFLALSVVMFIIVSQVCARLASGEMVL